MPTLVLPAVTSTDEPLWFQYQPSKLPRGVCQWCRRNLFFSFYVTTCTQGGFCVWPELWRRGWPGLAVEPSTGGHVRVRGAGRPGLTLNKLWPGGWDSGGEMENSTVWYLSMFASCLKHFLTFFFFCISPPLAKPSLLCFVESLLKITANASYGVMLNLEKKMLCFHVSDIRGDTIVSFISGENSWDKGYLSGAQKD